MNSCYATNGCYQFSAPRLFQAFRPCERISPCHVGGRTAILGNGLKFLKSFAIRIRLGGSSHLVSPSGLFSPPPAKPDFSLAFPWRYCPGPSGGSPGFWRGTLSRLAATLFLVLAASLAVPLPGAGGAAHADVLVSNLGQTGVVRSGRLLDNDYAQAFTTGDNATGYTLTSIELRFNTDGDNSTPRAKLYSGSANGTEVSTLTGPSSLVSFSARNYTFTPSSTVTLLTSATYWVVVEGNTGNTRVVTNDSTGEDGTSATGWGIGDLKEFRSASSTGSFTTESAPLHIRVNGTTVATSSDATLSALALEDASDDSAITISPVFASGTTSYTASVDNDVEKITINPTVNESSATVEYLDSSDTEITDADGVKTGQQVSLSVSANTIKVKVTAEDTTTTNTYTVVVTRAAAVPGTAAALVSNLGQTEVGSSEITTNDLAQSFETGTNAAGYTLTSIELRLDSNDSTDTPTVKLYSGSANGTEEATFTGPAMLVGSGSGDYTFTPSSTVTLLTSTTYWVVAEGVGAWIYTTSTSEDGTSATGWEIGDGYEYRAASSTGSFSTVGTSGFILQIRVNGTTGGGTPPANTAATGAPSISGTATVGQVLTATTGTIADADGLPSSFTYQWVRVDADGTSNEADITGANSSTYTLDDDDEGKKIKVKVSFTDNGGNSEMRTSGAYPTSGTVQASTTPGSAALVSNAGQTRFDSADLAVSDYAQSFTTGANATGYTLSSIELNLDSRGSMGSTSTPTVKLYRGSANGTEVSTFTGPAMLDAASRKNYAFTPSSPVTLGMSTTYWVVAEGDTDWTWTDSASEDATPATGWGIGDASGSRAASSTGSFTPVVGYPLMIRVNGTLGGIVISSDATLSALALEDASDDSAITISPTFASGTTSYTASVDNGVDEITIKPTVNEGSATVEYLDSSDTEIADADGVKAGQQVSLSVSANTIKVKVTAEDTTTTDTYTVVVTRAAAVPGVVTVSESMLTVTEEDTTGNTYTVVLDTQPTADVTVTVAGHSGTDVTPTPASLTFTTTNWSTAQTVTVKAGNDTDLTNDTVTLTHSAASTDPGYSGITIGSVVVTVTDNDTARVTGVTVTSSPDSGDTYGTGEMIQFTVTFDHAVTVTGTPEFEFCLGTGSCEVGMPPPSRRRAALLSGSGTTALVFSYTVVVGDVDDNGIWAGDQDRTIKLEGGTIQSTVGGLDAVLTHLAVGTKIGHKVNGAAAGVTVSKSALTVTEQNATGNTYTVLLDTRPMANVTVTVSGHGGTDVTLTSSFTSTTPSSGILTFTTADWNLVQTVTVKAGNDTDLTNDTVTLYHSAASTDSGYNGITIGSVVVTVADNDTAQVTGVVVTSGNAGLLVNWTEVSNATGYKVQWKSGTESYDTTRQATITSGSTTSHTIPNLTNGTEYTVQVTATRTGANDGPPSAGVMGTPEAAGVTVSESALTVTEQNATGGTYTVVLNTRPTVNVMVTVAGHGGTDVTLTPSSGTLTFTTTNWSTAQTVTVKAGDDADTTNDTVTLAHSATSTDTNYGGITIGSVVVTVADNDTAQVTGVVVTSGNAGLLVNWAAVGNATGYKVQWKSGTQSYNTGNRQAITSGSTISHTIPSLTNGTEYTVRVTATRTGANDGPPSAGVMGTPEAPGVTVSESALTVTEEDTTGDNYTVVLDTRPTVNVTVTVSGHGGTDVTPTPASLTFTTANWSTAQTVTVKATTDTDLTNDTVTLTHSAASTDPGYGGITIGSVVVTVADNDTAQVTGVVVTSGNARLVVNWAAVGNATGYKVQWKSGSEGYNTGNRQATITSGTTTSHTIPSLSNGTEYTVRVTATRTGANDGPPSAEEMGTPTVPTAPGVTVSTMALTVTEENTTGNTYTVVLDTQPTVSVTVTVAGHAGTDVTLTPSSGTLTFTTTNWNTAQTVTVKAGNDTDTTNDTVTLAHSATSTDGNYGGITIAGVTVTVTDNDTAQVTGVTVASGNARLVVNWVAVGNATGYKVQWKSGTQSYDTTRQATITLGTTTSHTIPSLTNGTEYTVRVTATRTGANDGPSSDEEMGTPGAAGVTVSESALTVTEQNATGGTYTVVLDTQPTANVTVTVSRPAGTEVTLTPSSGTLTFTTTNWNTAQTVTVKAGNDADTTNDTVTLTHSATSTDTNYGGVTIGSVVVTVTDNDTARVTGVTVASGNARLVVNWVAVGNATGYKVQWKSGGQSYNTGNRQATITSGSTTSHPIPSLANGTEYTVRVTATRMGASDGLPSAEVMETPEVVTAAGVTVSTMALTVREQNATGGTYTVVLGTQPTANVMVTVSGHAGTDVTPTPASLTFTTTNWSTAQTVTVTARNDTDTTNDRVTLTHSATSTDPGYNGIMIGSVVVTVTDNDVVTPPQPVNAPPEFGGSSATRSMDETVGGGAAGTAVKVGAPVTAVDPDGDTIEYSLSGTDRDKFDINRNTGQLLSRAGERYDHEEKSSYEVRVSASDGEGGTDTIEVAISINNVSEAPEAPGAPRVRASGMTALGISWSAPRNAGRPDITGYDLRYRNTAETDWSDGPRGVEETETEVPGLLEDTEYEVQVRAVNAEGSGEWSEPASGRTGMQPVGIAAAWLGRFGRTVAEHVLSGVSARITALRSSGMKATLGGLDLFPVKSPDELLRGRDDTEELTGWLGEEEEDSFRFLTLAGHDIRTRSSFALGRSAGGGFGAVWGSGAFGGFNGRESGVSFDGEVRTGMLGADYAVGSLVAGVVLSRSVGEGSYRNGRGSGKVKSSVTGIYPYAGNDLSEKFSVWAVAGYGRGEMGVTLPGEGERSSADIDIKMAAAGARGDLVSGANEAGIGVSVEMDTLFVRTTSEGGRGIEAADADVSRVRLSVQGSVGHAFGGGGMIRPLVEAGIRRDGGDAEAGFGADLGAGLQFSDATGELSMQIRGRTLIVHEAGGFRDWGVSGSLRYDPYPDSPRGLMMSLGHSAGGASDGGADALLGRGTLGGLGEGEAVEWNSRLVGEAGYGFGVLGGVFTGTPYAGFGASEGLRDYYLGLRLARMNRNAFDCIFRLNVNTDSD